MFFDMFILRMLINLSSYVFSRHSWKIVFPLHCLLSLKKVLKRDHRTLLE